MAVLKLADCRLWKAATAGVAGGAALPAILAGAAGVPPGVSRSGLGWHVRLGEARNHLIAHGAKPTSRTRVTCVIDA